MAVADARGHGLPAALQARDVIVGLRMGAQMHFKMVSTVERLNSVIARSVYKTMSAVFSSVVVLGESELMASNSQLAADADDLMARAGSIRAHLPRIDDRIATLRRPLPDPIGATLLTDDYAPVDTMLRQR